MRVVANVTFTQHMNVRCPCLLIAENATANFGLRLVAIYMSQVKRARSQPTQSPVPHESFPRQRDREEGRQEEERDRTTGGLRIRALMEPLTWFFHVGSLEALKPMLCAAYSSGFMVQGSDSSTRV